MNADSLRVLVSDYFASRAASFGLDPRTLVVEYVLNRGGFVNYSYRIRDARHAYHLKLSSSADDQGALRRWLTLAPLLQPYHAPPILEWIDLGPATGLLFPSLPGDPPACNERVITEVMLVLRELNADRGLALALRPPRAISAQAAYLTSFHRRFEEDLRGIRESPPPFVGADRVRWLEEQAGILSRLVASTAAFGEPSTSRFMEICG